MMVLKMGGAPPRFPSPPHPSPFLSKTFVWGDGGFGPVDSFLSGRRPLFCAQKREAMRNVTIFTDGSCLGNPGRGGWGCILRCEGHEKELSGGYAHTANNRMEIMAAIAGLEELKEPCAVTLYTDSQYLRHAVEKKWLAGWRKNGWKTAAKKPVKNRDLWERLQVQLDRHSVTLEWVRGHNGHAENERCDELARSQSARHDLPEDTGYEPE